MKKFFFAFFVALLFFIGFKILWKDEKVILLTEKKIDITQINEVKKVIKSNSKYNNRIAFFIDMKIPSGKNRFFVYDLKENKIIDRGLVAHGSGSETGLKGKLRFSNIPNSLSTSLGKYAIGNHYNGKFGKAYKLYGLDKTNSNAFKRDIVFHYYFDVPYKEKDGYICNSYGCPMVNKKYFDRIAKIIDSSESDILMSIYY
ncbi:L,D-transpeptidase-like protein [Flavobacterium sp. 90]|uniref:murein L,D-transpeptidase catalytic domain-containing protein n=1 Tax=unclassified Flavobacterium TaxID=196869 RepID=UPI000EB2D485|nr:MULTISPECIES: murein L,D-transpeptidase catalytic domain family protein [unclassified Flavobacterium]RKR05242.1 L,D-transpeptidase-like protein [Flavobacterium sp. 81]TCK56557.1 L,D-transpeptidase-like protein [Flavobacterium sp. 90]